MKNKDEILVIEKSAVVKKQEYEIPMLAASSGSKNDVSYLFVIMIVFYCYFSYGC